jgi:hypothetical protein
MSKPMAFIVSEQLLDDFSIGHFQHLVTHCRESIKPMLVGDPTRESDMARSRILRRLDLQLGRASSWATLEVDLLAISLRLVIELLMWARFISKGPREMELFLHDAKIDVRELFEKIAKLSDGTDDLSAFTSFEMPEGKRVRTEPGTNIEEALLKICHKLEHPSAWLLGEMDAILNDESLRKSLATNLIFFAWEVIHTFHNIEAL